MKHAQHITGMIERLRAYTAQLENHVYTRRAPARDVFKAENVAGTFDAPGYDLPWNLSDVGGLWKGNGDAVAFKAQITVPPTAETETRFILVFENALPTRVRSEGDASYAGHVYINGTRVASVDEHHTHIPFNFTQGTSYEVRILLFHYKQNTHYLLREFALYSVSDAVAALITSLTAIAAVASRIPKERAVLLLALAEKATRALPETFDGMNAHTVTEYALRAKGLLSDALALHADNTEALARPLLGTTAFSLAHAPSLEVARHMRIASYQRVLSEITQNEAYTIVLPGVYAYAWVAESALDLKDAIQKYVREGTWHIDGGLWAQPALHMIRGESLVRHILYGKRFLANTFGVTSTTFWFSTAEGFPETFPQIATLSGVSACVAHTLSRGADENMPDVCMWEACNGSVIFLAKAKGVAFDETSHCGVRERNETNIHTISGNEGAFGPTNKTIASAQASAVFAAKAPGTYDAFTTVANAVKPHGQTRDTLPRWRGEIPLRSNRGDYTRNARLIARIRECETLLHALEVITSKAKGEGFTFAKETLDTLWQGLLFAQSAEIMKGAICDAFVSDIVNLVDDIAQAAENAIESACDYLIGKMKTNEAEHPHVLFNTLPWDRQDPVTLPDGRVFDTVTVPAYGWVVVDIPKDAPPKETFGTKETSENVVVHNRFWEIEFGENGTIRRIFDTTHKREVVAQGARANEWQVFADPEGRVVDAMLPDERLEGPALTSIAIEEEKPAILAVVLTFTFPEDGNEKTSTLRQTLRLYNNHPRIDFITEVVWNKRGSMLATAFPVNVCARSVTCHSAFSSVMRPTHTNTDADRMQGEMPSLGFVDLSDAEYGVTLATRDRVGYHVKGNTLSLTCLTSCDASEHAQTFTYSLFPHKGTAANKDVLRTAYEIAEPVRVRTADTKNGTLPPVYSFVISENDSIIVEAIKPAEDGNGLILRVYEAYGTQATTTLTFAKPVFLVDIVDLLEAFHKEDVALQHEDNKISFTLRPHQILTLRVVV